MCPREGALHDSLVNDGNDTAAPGDPQRGSCITEAERAVITNTETMPTASVFSVLFLATQVELCSKKSEALQFNGLLLMSNLESLKKTTVLPCK